MKHDNPEALKREVERLRGAIAHIAELASELVDGEQAARDAAAARVQAELERLRRLVSYDELTQALNRRGFYERFRKLFDDALYTKAHADAPRAFRISDFSLVFLDLDDFKQINDTYGHDAGDEVLRQSAALFSAHTRGIDGVARLGGEEFLLALVGADEAHAAGKAERVREVLTKQVSVPGDAERRVSASIGVASLHASDADTLDELVGYADAAMYEAKKNRGKNTVVRWSEIAKR